MKVNSDSPQSRPDAPLKARLETRSMPLAMRASAGLSLALLTAGMLTISSCSSGSPSTSASAAAAARTSNAGNFTATVFLGDSLSAGYQSGSLLDTAEVHGWAPLVAGQASFAITQALIAYPGAPSTLLLQSPGPPPVIVSAAGTTIGRTNPASQVTDLAVPGAFLNDIANTLPMVNPATGEEQITQLVLGFPGLGLGQAYSQATFAVKANPTTIFLWAGNNDALVADIDGTPASMTSVADFTTQYTALITELTTKTTAHLVIANIPDVTLVPYLSPAAIVLGEYAAATGYPAATLGVLFDISPGDFVTPEGLTEIAAILAGTQKTPLSDAGVLTAAEAVTVQANVVAYNKVITTQAAAAGATLVDINALFNGLAAKGQTINGYAGTTGFLGGLFGLDGIHPSNVGYAIVANTFIDTMNAAFKSSIADVDLAAVAAADPLWPPNFAATSAARPGTRHMALPGPAARGLRDILSGPRSRP